MNSLRQMLTVTDSAVKHLQVLLASEPEQQGKGLRLSVEKGGCAGLQYAMALDEPHAGDEILDQGGVRFIVDAASAGQLRGSVIDYADDLAGAGFRIRNPNAARSCGCGTSFEPAGPDAAGV